MDATARIDHIKAVIGTLNEQLEAAAEEGIAFKLGIQDSGFIQKKNEKICETEAWLVTQRPCKIVLMQITQLVPYHTGVLDSWGG